jgi:transposase
MARGRKTSHTIRLAPEERQTLLAWQRAMTIPAGVARRARIILLLADAVPITDIAATVGLSRRHTHKWIKRFVQEGLEGLYEKPRADRRIASRPPDLREPRNNLERG